jgi:hypothetical protein
MLGIGSAGDPIAATDRKRAALEVSYFSGLGALIVFVGGVAVARLAVRLASDIKALARVEDARAARAADPAYAEPQYLPGLEEPSDVPSGAVTTPRVERYTVAEAELKQKWRRQRAASGSPGAAYLRWPHPQR